MDDLISRQAAIRWVKTECNPYGKPTLDFESGKKVIKHLELMPSAEPDWIPTSERLPEPDVDVLLQLSDMMATGYWFYDGWHVYFSTERKDVIAWCKLPEPYAERRQNGSNKD